MDDVAVFERELERWRQAEAGINYDCTCCRRRSSMAGREVLLGWAALDRVSKLAWLDEHGDDAFVAALQELVALTRDAGGVPL